MKLVKQTAFVAAVMAASTYACKSEKILEKSKLIKTLSLWATLDFLIFKLQQQGLLRPRVLD